MSCPTQNVSPAHEQGLHRERPVDHTTYHDTTTTTAPRCTAHNTHTAPHTQHTHAHAHKRGASRVRLLHACSCSMQFLSQCWFFLLLARDVLRHALSLLASSWCASSDFASSVPVSFFTVTSLSMSPFLVLSVFCFHLLFAPFTLSHLFHPLRVVFPHLVAELCFFLKPSWPIYHHVKSSKFHLFHQTSRTFIIQYALHQKLPTGRCPGAGGKQQVSRGPKGSRAC